MTIYILCVLSFCLGSREKGKFAPQEGGERRVCCPLKMVWVGGRRVPSRGWGERRVFSPSKDNGMFPPQESGGKRVCFPQEGVGEGREREVLKGGILMDL